MCCQQSKICYFWITSLSLYGVTHNSLSSLNERVHTFVKLTTIGVVSTFVLQYILGVWQLPSKPSLYCQSYQIVSVYIIFILLYFSCHHLLCEFFEFWLLFSMWMYVVLPLLCSEHKDPAILFSPFCCCQYISPCPLRCAATITTPQTCRRQLRFLLLSICIVKGY